MTVLASSREARSEEQHQAVERTEMVIVHVELKRRINAVVMARASDHLARVLEAMVISRCRLLSYDRR
jgi:hypothetical protein